MPCCKVWLFALGLGLVGLLSSHRAQRRDLVRALHDALCYIISIIPLVFIVTWTGAVLCHDLLMYMYVCMCIDPVPSAVYTQERRPIHYLED